MSPRVFSACRKFCPHVAVLVSVAASSVALASDVQMVLEPVVLGQPVSLEFESGAPGAKCVVGASDALDPIVIPWISATPIDLDLSNDVVLGEVDLDALGDGGLPLPVGLFTRMQVGQLFYLQAVCTDPATSTGYEVTNLLSRGVHPNTETILQEN